MPGQDTIDCAPAVTGKIESTVKTSRGVKTGAGRS